MAGLPAGNAPSGRRKRDAGPRFYQMPAAAPTPRRAGSDVPAGSKGGSRGRRDEEEPIPFVTTVAGAKTEIFHKTYLIERADTFR